MPPQSEADSKLLAKLEESVMEERTRCHNAFDLRETELHSKQSEELIKTGTKSLFYF